MLLRPVPGDSVVHRLWAGTKLVCVLIVALTLSLVPSWPAIGIGFALVLATAWLGGVPPTVVPRVPWWFGVLLVVGGLFSLPSGPGAVLDYLRLTVLSIVLLAASALLGWTTPVGELAPALSRLGAPLRLIRVPVNEWAVAVALCLRSLPLIIEELRVLNAVRRLRPRPARRRTWRAGFAEIVDLVTAAMAVSIRRAAELGAAIHARGGSGQLAAHPGRPGWRDAVAVLVVAGACAVAALV